MKILSILILASLCGCVHAKQGGKVDWAAQPSSIGLELDPVPVDGHLAYLVAELRINGHPGRFMVDTGASNCWLNPDFAHRLGLTVTAGKLTNIGAGAKAPDMARIDWCDFGFAKVSGLFFVIGDLFEYANKQLLPEKKIDGLIGLDLLTIFSAEIHAGRRVILFHKPPNQ